MDRGYGRETALMRAFAECARVGDPQLAEGVGQLLMPSKPA
jgi:hypothetical protein